MKNCASSFLEILGHQASAMDASFDIFNDVTSSLAH